MDDSKKFELESGFGILLMISVGVFFVCFGVLGLSWGSWFIVLIGFLGAAIFFLMGGAMIRGQSTRRQAIIDGQQAGVVSISKKIKEIIRRMDLPEEVGERTTDMFSRLEERDLIGDRPTEVVVAACVYWACRECDTPRRMDDISRATSVDRKEIGKTYRYIIKELKLKSMMQLSK